jgi:hypothetical protein
MMGEKAEKPDTQKKKAQARKADANGKVRNKVVEHGESHDSTAQQREDSLQPKC